MWVVVVPSAGQEAEAAQQMRGRVMAIRWCFIILKKFNDILLTLSLGNR